MGGLGNQMFQYAAGLRLALEKKQRLLVDTSILEDHSPGRHDVNRKYGLDIFKLQVQKATRYERWLYNAHGLPLIVRILKRILGPVTEKRIYRNLSFEYDKNLFDAMPVPRYIQGLWQSYMYVEPIAKKIKEEFEFRNSLCKKALSIKDTVQKKNSVCIHVRRKDYTSGMAASFMSPLGKEFYQTADQIIQKKILGKPKYHVFSDDIEWCRKELAWLGPETVFCDSENSGSREEVDLHLMSLSARFIIPNSTFSWWAAWLAKAPDKQVIAPKRWFTDTNINTQDLCPPSWQRI